MRRSLQGRTLWILLAVVGLLLVVAIASVAIYLLLQQEPQATGWQDPIIAILPEEIAADLALYPLAGASELDTVDAAIDNGDLETAYAALVFGVDLSDAQRIGRLILLGGRFPDAEKPERAALAYQQITDTAVLSPDLNDPARADALLASGRGWAVLGEEDRALEAYDQAYLIAVQSPNLQMANRRDLLSALETAYRDLGAAERAEASRAAIVELDQQTTPHPPVSPGRTPDLLEGESVISTPEVGALEDDRRQAAFALLEPLSEGNDPPADVVATLAQALQAEDAAKLALYQQELESTTQPNRRISVNRQLVRWLMLKYKVASGGFGISLVSEWEAELAEIQSELSKAWEGLFFDYEDLVTSLPEASLIDPGNYVVRRHVLLDGRLGRYPNYPAEQLADKMQDSVRNLISSQTVDQLYVDVQRDDGDLHFFLSSGDEYGQSSQSP
jgi:tetratricopeptide (TPR) repeat protein